MIDTTKPVFRCSGLAQLFLCPASRVLMPLCAPRTGKEGFEGAKIHWDTAWRLVKELGASQPPGGLPKASVPADFRLNQFAVWMTGWFVNHVRFTYPRDWSLEVEAGLSYEFDRFILSGHEDVHGLNRDATACRGSDWKTGRKTVSQAARNWQVKGYHALNRRAYPKLQSSFFEICQPMNNEEHGFPKITSSELDRNQLDALLHEINEEGNKALDRWEIINSGMAQCEWCNVGVQCPSIQGDTEEMQTKLTKQFLAQIKREPDDALLADMVMKLRTLTNPAKTATEMLHDRITAKGSIESSEGVKITRVMEGGSYTITNPERMFKGLTEMLPPEKLAPALNYPIGRIVHAIAEKHNVPATGKKPITGEKLLEAKFGDCIEQGEKRTLVFSNDL